MRVPCDEGRRVPSGKGTLPGQRRGVAPKGLRVKEEKVPTLPLGAAGWDGGRATRHRRSRLTEGHQAGGRIGGPPHQVDEEAAVARETSRKAAENQARGRGGRQARQAGVQGLQGQAALGVQGREVRAGAGDQAEAGPGLQGRVEIAEEGRVGRQAFEDAALDMVFH